MKSAGKARNDGLYRHIRTSKEIIRNLLNDYDKHTNCAYTERDETYRGTKRKHCYATENRKIVYGAGRAADPCGSSPAGL